MKCLSGAVDEGCFRADGVGFLGGGGQGIVRGYGPA